TEFPGDVAVVLGACIDVLDQKADGRAGGDAFEHARQDFDRVGFLTLSRVLGLAGAALIEPHLDVGLRQRKTRRHAVDDAADGGAMTLAEGREAEERAEGVCGHKRRYLARFAPLSRSAMPCEDSGA